ncbi:hypothetical protein NDU88_007242 [Pleurodeles waltl]|uniref:Uncharacterized protein n=1 Tax=Pleurodeles waltl TaxID=8319 RepID=A0AAV7UNA2_PLEWA|nr:hypothetical protein NDU88_007242 [Pleurodeles waltl]
MGSQSDPFHDRDHVLYPEGGNVVLYGALDGRELRLLNVFEPNNDRPDFYARVAAADLSYLTTDIIMTGDCNCVLDSARDRKLPRHHTKTHLTRALSDLM